ncbi:MAG: anti-sigma factor [Chitinophagaceae bacterium]|nr:anti-sigma factor [Chitinophagaceae bacterium]
MDIKAYIESGIVESYVMRLTSPEETAEVESMMAAYPEVAAAVTNFELLLEQRLMNEAIDPPAYIKEQLVNTLATEFSDADNNELPIRNISSQVVALSSGTPLWKYVAVASIALFLGSGWLNFHYYSKYAAIEQDYKTLLANQGSLMANLNANQAKMKGMEDIMKIIMDPAVKPVSMLPPNKSNAMLATAYWNSNTKALYVAQNNMPAAPAGRQYQLWALIKGKPVNAGMIDDCGQILCKMADISEADSFAITLEKAGGSPTPDLTQLKVIGTI